MRRCTEMKTITNRFGREWVWLPRTKRWMSRLPQKECPWCFGSNQCPRCDGIEPMCAACGGTGYCKHCVTERHTA